MKIFKFIKPTVLLFWFSRTIFFENAKEFRAGLQVLLKENVDLDYRFCGIYEENQNDKVERVQKYFKKKLEIIKTL